MMARPEPRRPTGLRLHDLVGLVVGYGMAALLARSFWPRSRPLSGVPAVALVIEFCWLGLAMSGPIVLLLDRRGVNSPVIGPRRPARPGRLISSKGEADLPPPVGRGPASGPSGPEPPPSFTRAELAWMVIGGYWIALTLFVVPALSIDTPWALAGLLQLVGAFGLWLVVPRSIKAGSVTDSWTHTAAVGLLSTWPIAWVCLILLSRSL